MFYVLLQHSNTDYIWHNWLWWRRCGCLGDDSWCQVPSNIECCQNSGEITDFLLYRSIFNLKFAIFFLISRWVNLLLCSMETSPDLIHQIKVKGFHPTVGWNVMELAVLVKWDRIRIRCFQDHTIIAAKSVTFDLIFLEMFLIFKNTEIKLKFGYTIYQPCI